MKKVLQILGVIFILQIIVVAFFSFTSEEIIYTSEPEIIEHSRATSYGKASLVEFHKSVLESMGIEYTEEARDEKQWVRWSPQSDEVETEITNRVSQYNFVSTVCSKLPLPKPTDPAKKELSCSDSQ